jgi:hypothetical protein
MTGMHVIFYRQYFNQRFFTLLQGLAAYGNPRGDVLDVVLNVFT